jgi:hypothetical protein
MPPSTKVRARVGDFPVAGVTVLAELAD